MKLILKFAVLCACLIPCLTVFAQLPSTQYSEGVAYISGGVGEEESIAILSEAKQWPLMLELSQIENGRGIWIFGASVKIANTQKKIIFDAQADGPYILINIEPGEYILQASYQDVEQKRALSIKAGQPQKASVFWK